MLEAKRNALIYLGFWEPVRYYQSVLEKPWAPSQVWLRPSFIEQYNFKFIDLVKEGNVEYTKIEYSTPDSVNYKASLLRDGHLLVDTKDYGIREFEYVFRFNPLIHQNGFGVEEENFVDKLQVSYQKIKGTYYP